MRVLLVSGGPTWEYQYLTRLLERDATFNLSVWLQSADKDAVREGTTVIDHFPRTQEELFQYDCIILLDPQPADVDPAWTACVEQLVGNYGGGLLYVAGRINAPRFCHESGTRPLLDLLPVVIDPNESDLMLNELGHFQTTAWPFFVPSAVANNPVLALSDQPAENTQIWNNLPGVYWHYPVRREKPVATVLLRHSNPRCATRTADTCFWPRSSSAPAAPASWPSTPPGAGGATATATSTASGCSSCGTWSRANCSPASNVG